MNKLTVRTSSKKSDNKGFSLVELIIVIAIMAVLVAVLTPQLLKYVERSRVARDNTNLDEVERSISLALSDEATYLKTSGEIKITYANGGGTVGSPGTPGITITGTGNAELATEMATILGNFNALPPLASSEYKGKNVLWTVTIPSTTNSAISIVRTTPTT